MAGDAPLLILTTVGTEEDASRIARLLVEERLAACVNVVPGVRSVYWWEGRVNLDAELLLLVKTTEPLVDAVQARLAEVHPYDIPEFVVVEPERLAPRYLQWVIDSVRPS
jgi:periplasmic divalent cation tolerance protein